MSHTEWAAWVEGYGNDYVGDKVSAQTARKAAEQYAEDWCRAHAMWPGDLVVCVRSGGGAWWRFEVTIESAPKFSARLAK